MPLSMWWSPLRATCSSMETTSVWCITPLYVRAGQSMPPDTPTPGSPEDWLRHARSDLALAQQRSAPEILLTTLCFHTQQAAEKGIKAVLVQQGPVCARARLHRGQ